MRGNSAGRYSSRGGSSYRRGSSAGGYYNEPYYSSPTRGGHYHNSRGRGRGGSSGPVGGYYNNNNAGNPESMGNSGYTYPSGEYNSSVSGVGSSPVVSASFDRPVDTPGSNEGHAGVRSANRSSGSEVHNRGGYDEYGWDSASSQSFQHGRGGFYSNPKFSRGGRGRGRGSFRGGYNAGAYHGNSYEDFNSGRGGDQYQNGYYYEEPVGYDERQPYPQNNEPVTQRYDEKPTEVIAVDVNKPDVTKSEPVVTQAEVEKDNKVTRELEMKIENEFKEKHWVKRIKLTGDMKTSLSKSFDELDAVNSNLLKIGSRRVELEMDVMKYNRVLRAEEERVRMAEESLEAMEFS